MENITIESLQYRNIVRKFFFRQNPPKPLTKEEFIENYGEAYENEYYTYLYSFLSQYVADLDQRVDKEISEGAVNDSYLAEIEKELEKNKDSGIYSKNNNDIKKDPDNNDLVFQRKSKRNIESNHNDLNETTKDSSIVEGEYESKKFSPLKNVKAENHEKEKKGFFRKAVEKVKAKISKPASKKEVRKNLIDGFSISAAAALGVSIFGCYTLGLKVITSAISMKVGVIAGLTSLVTGVLASSGLWIAHTYYQAKRTGTSLDEFDDFDEEEEEKGGFLQELKNKFSNSKEEEYEEAIDNEDEFDNTASKAMDDINDKRNDSSTIFKVLRKNDGRKPHFDSAREENHESLQVGDTFLERVDGEIVKEDQSTKSNIFDEIDEEIQDAHESAKVKIK